MGDGTNTLFIAGEALGLLPNTNLDALALLPDGSVLFSVETSSGGVGGSAVAASLGTRALDIFRSFGNGTNTLFRSAAELGLTAGELTGLAWNADGTLLFSVAPNSRGVNSCALPCYIEWELFCLVNRNPAFLPPLCPDLLTFLNSVAQVRGVPGSAVAAAAPATLPNSVFLTVRLAVSDDVAVAALDVVVGGTAVKTTPFPGPVVATVQGSIRCTVTFFTPQGETLAATVTGVPPVLGGRTDVARLHLVVVVRVGMVIDDTSQQAIVFDATTDTLMGTVALPSGFDSPALLGSRASAMLLEIASMYGAMAPRATAAPSTSLPITPRQHSSVLHPC